MTFTPGSTSERSPSLHRPFIQALAGHHPNLYPMKNSLTRDGAQHSIRSILDYRVAELQSHTHPTEPILTASPTPAHPHGSCRRSSSPGRVSLCLDGWQPYRRRRARCLCLCFRPPTPGKRGRPQDHERRLHGRRYAGVRLVQQEPTRMVALDGHVYHESPLTGNDLQPFGHARVPASSQEAVERGKSMRQGRSRNTRDA